MRLSLPWSRPREPLSNAEALQQWDGAYRWSGEVGPEGLHFGSAGSLQAPDTLLEDLAGLGGGRISRRDALRATAIIRARNLIASVPATMPLELRDKDRKLDERNWLGEQPNPLIETTVMFASTFEDLFFDGVSYWRITRMASDGYPLEAEHLDHRAVSQARIMGQGSRVISEDLQFTPEDPVYVDAVETPLSSVTRMAFGRARVGDVIRFTSPNPPLLVHAAHAIRVLLLLDRAAADYASDPLPFGYFKDATDETPLDDTKINEVLSKWEKARKARRWGYIGEGLELHPLEWPTPQQLQLIEARNHAVLEIARATGLDASDLTTNIEGSSMTYANVAQRRLDLIDFAFNPYISAAENRLSMGDITPSGLWAHFNVSGFTRADFKSRMEGYKIGVEARDSEGRPVLEVNEARRMEGWPDVKKPPKPAPPPMPPSLIPPNANGNGNGQSNGNGRQPEPSEAT